MYLYRHLIADDLDDAPLELHVVPVREDEADVAGRGDSAVVDGSGLTLDDRSAAHRELDLGR